MGSKQTVTTDVVVVGGGPAGLSAALTLGRGLKKVLVCDAGPRRNAAAEHLHNFVTRDGIPPAEFRRIAREQLVPYDVTVREVGVEGITPRDGGFDVTLTDGTTVGCRRVLLATGMVDEVPDLPGIREVWGRSVFQCPYCHGWELRGQPWGVMATQAMHLEVGLFVTGWSPRVTVFTNGALDVPEEMRARLTRAKVQVETRRVVRLVAGDDGALRGVAVEGGHVVETGALVMRPPQRQVALVQRLGVALDENGFVKVAAYDETSIPGIHAAGDLATPMQGALLAAAAGTRSAAMVNHILNVEAAEAQQ